MHPEELFLELFIVTLRRTEIDNSTETDVEEQEEKLCVHRFIESFCRRGFAVCL